MEISLINIGNSKGILLSKTLIEKYQLKDRIQLILEEDCLVLKSIDTPRKNWEQAFQLMHEQGDDKTLIDDVFEDENFDEWI